MAATHDGGRVTHLPQLRRVRSLQTCRWNVTASEAAAAQSEENLHYLLFAILIDTVGGKHLWPVGGGGHE